MKRNDDDPLVSLVFTVLAMLCALVGGWCFLRLVFGDADSLGEGRRVMTEMFSWWGAGLGLWWMAEVCGLLARILGRLGEPMGEGAEVRREVVETKKSPVGRTGDDGVYRLD